MTQAKQLRIWWEIGRLQGQLEVLQEQVAELRRERGPHHRS